MRALQICGARALERMVALQRADEQVAAVHRMLNVDAPLWKNAPWICRRGPAVFWSCSFSRQKGEPRQPMLLKLLLVRGR